MRYSRAQRRHHARRIYRKRLAEQVRGIYRPNWEQGYQWAVRNARLYVHTSKLCSCICCCNQRRVHGNGKAAYTMQEVRQFDAFRDGLAEVGDE